MDPHPTGAETVDQDEVARFSRLASEWWDPHGPMAALHKFNPVRLAYIRDRTAEHFGRDPKSLGSLSGLRFLDIGCGGGILCEPLARLGASVVGADPSAKNIAVARSHAAQSGLTIDYRDTTAEALAGAGELFDVVLAHDVAFSKAERQPREQLARNPPFEPAQHGKRQQGGERGKNCRIEKADPVDNSAAEEAAVVNPRTVKKPCLNTTPAPIKPIPVMMPCAMRLGLVLKSLLAAMPSQLAW